MAELCVDALARRLAACPPSPSGLARPFKLVVREEVFTVDSERLGRLSPVFALMCFGRDFEGGRELTREIVDEKSADIATFLRCLHDNRQIDEWNIPTLLRLAHKYQVESLTKACSDYLEKTNLSSVKPDQVLTLLIAANDFRLAKGPVGQLVLRLAQEEKAALAPLRLGRHLAVPLCTAVFATHVNVLQIREVETMNGHMFRMERNKTYTKRALCQVCKRIATQAADCEGCKGTFCREHWLSNRCTSEYGRRMLQQLREHIVDLEWNE